MEQGLSVFPAPQWGLFTDIRNGSSAARRTALDILICFHHLTPADLVRQGPISESLTSGDVYAFASCHAIKDIDHERTKGTHR